MENFLRKYDWAPMLALIGVGAIVVAFMVNNVVASYLAPHTVPELPEFSTPDKGEPTGRADSELEDWKRAVADRCLFGCAEEEDKNECEGGCPDGEECEEGKCVAVEDEEDEEEISDVPVESELEMRLLGAMVATPAEYSMALILDEENDETLMLSPGDYLTEDAELIRIRRDRILIERENGQEEFIRMDKSIEGNPSAMPASTFRPQRPSSAVERRGAGSRSGSDKKDKKEKERQKREARKKRSDKSGASTIEVDRDRVDEVLDDPSKLATQGRAVENVENGKPNGLKIVGTGSSSIYSDLGIESGDVIQGVNGNKVNSQREAMRLFEAMKNEDSVSLEVERGGKSREIEYQIR